MSNRFAAHDAPSRAAGSTSGPPPGDERATLHEAQLAATSVVPGADMPTKTVPTTRDALPLLLTAEEVAALLRTTRKAVYAMAERASLPGAVRIGRRLLVHRDDLLRWLDERRTPSPGRTRR